MILLTFLVVWFILWPYGRSFWGQLELTMLNQVSWRPFFLAAKTAFLSCLLLCPSHLLPLQFSHWLLILFMQPQLIWLFYFSKNDSASRTCAVVTSKIFVFETFHREINQSKSEFAHIAALAENYWMEHQHCLSQTPKSEVCTMGHLLYSEAWEWLYECGASSSLLNSWTHFSACYLWD